MMRGRLPASSTWIAMLMAAWAAALVGPSAFAQSGTASDGFYTPAQATHGEQVFKQNCAACHNADLKGKGKAPALTGEPFLDMWAGETVGRLFTKITGTMPRADPGSLADEEYIDVLAYIMQVNVFPKGATELKEDALANIQIELPSGTAPKPLRNFKLVEVVGCLARTDNAWTLTHGSQPMVTQDEPAGAVPANGVKPLGSETFRLSSVTAFKPDAHEGHKVQLKGLLYRAGPDNRLDVTAFQSIAASCTR